VTHTLRAGAPDTSSDDEKIAASRKPNSVRRSPACAGGGVTTIPLAPPSLAGSSDRPGSTGRAVQRAPARRPRRGAHASLFGLAPCGVLPATRVTTGAVRSYRTFSPLPSSVCRSLAVPAAEVGRYIFCATVLQVALTGRYPAHCPAEFGLSSTSSPLRDPPPRPSRSLRRADCTTRPGSRRAWRRRGPVCDLSVVAPDGRAAALPDLVRVPRASRRSPARSGIVRASCTDCCAACRSILRSSRCSSRSRAACRRDTRARRSP
jgi:hypothetical protein